jgi:hypothetical protein
MTLYLRITTENTFGNIETTAVKCKKVSAKNIPNFWGYKWNQNECYFGLFSFRWHDEYSWKKEARVYVEKQADLFDGLVHYFDNKAHDVQIGGWVNFLDVVEITKAEFEAEAGPEVIQYLKDVRKKKVQGPRDMRKWDVYEAEDDALRGLSGDFDSFEDVQAYADTIITSEFWNKYRNENANVTMNDKSVSVTTSPNWNTSFGDTWRIQISENPSHMTEYIVIHELAHVLVHGVLGLRRATAGHGPEWCGVYLRMVNKFMGELAYTELKDAFDAANINYDETILETLLDTNALLDLCDGYEYGSLNGPERN